MAAMQNLRYDLDPQGDTILVLRHPNTNQPLWEPKDEVSKLKQKNRTRRRKLFGLDFMSDTEDEHSHDEQTPESISPSIDPNVPIEREIKSDSAEKDLDTDSQETPQENSDRHEVEFRLSSRHLALASPVFKAMLSGFWKESAPSSDEDNGLAKPWSPLQSGSSCQVHYELTATEWVVKDFLLLMNIVHGHSGQVPYSIDLETLARMSVLVDYYQCQEVTKFAVGLWIGKIPRLPRQYGRDCIIWIFASWVFSRSEIFEKMTLLAITSSDGGLGKIYLPFPPMLLSTATPHLHGLSTLIYFVAVLEQKIDDYIDEIFSVVGKLCKDLWKGRRGCSFECTSMLLGSLMKVMDENELYTAFSAEQATRAVLSLKSGTWSTYPSENLGASSHSCTLEKLLRPDIKRLFVGLKGLKLDDYNGKKKKSADVSASTSRD
ncbi:hypothetical protein E4U56_001186 [Claviceps arundinis]|uniref:BTB domain-containing protein n=1 Tax=Claviceps arundinis TaxID=1623583 RepID=A0A9P7MQW2_9HYPO|nr:hypothetical protein E4U56_001186 [Claviceps arundinis]